MDFHICQMYPTAHFKYMQFLTCSLFKNWGEKYRKPSEHRHVPARKSDATAAQDLREHRQRPLP